MIHAVAYVSRARDSLVTEDLKRILHRAVAFNRIAGVTGVLLFDGQRFFQYLEGPVDGVNAAVGRIEQSRSHSDIRFLTNQRVGKRLIPYWSMQTFPQDQLKLDALVQADWNSVIADLGDPAHLSGIQRLLELVTPNSEAK